MDKTLIGLGPGQPRTPVQMGLGILETLSFPCLTLFLMSHLNESCFNILVFSTVEGCSLGDKNKDGFWDTNAQLR